MSSMLAAYDGCGSVAFLQDFVALGHAANMLPCHVYGMITRSFMPFDDELLDP